MHLIPWWNWFLKFFKHYFGGLYLRFDTHHIFLFAGGLAFSLFVCIIPFVLIIFWILGNFLSSAEVEGQIVTLINTVIPYDEYSNFVKDIIFKRVYEVIEFKNLAGIIGIVGLFFAASGFFSSMRTVLNKINGTDIDVNVFLGKLRDFLFIISVILLFFISIMALPLLELFISIAQETPYLQFFAHPIFQRVFTAIFSLLIMYFIFYAFYRYIPTVKIRSRSALVGAGWAALLWVGMKILFGYYLSNFGTWGRIYGAYALVVVIAFWIYYTAAVFIIGAEIGKLFDERLNERISRKNLIAASDSSK
ncbi:MAG TPA: YihY/virulence factor BrkB family protein [Ignavibacteriaceae bacterium]|nr:YihY/virulence factor BrkB family protein [Ignavibacteriaceae bacterium]